MSTEYDKEKIYTIFIYFLFCIIAFSTYLKINPFYINGIILILLALLILISLLNANFE